MFIPENIHTGSIIQTEQVIFGNVCVYAHNNNRLKRTNERKKERERERQGERKREREEKKKKGRKERQP